MQPALILFLVRYTAYIYIYKHKAFHRATKKIRLSLSCKTVVCYPLFRVRESAEGEVDEEVEEEEADSHDHSLSSLFISSGRRWC